MHISVTQPVDAADVPSAWVPPLENGERLTRDEFERRYAAMPEHIKAELIAGVVHMSSPVRIKSHAVPNNDLAGWLSMYRAFTPKVHAGNNATVRLGLDHEVQPDELLCLDPAAGGRVVIDADDYISGAPEWIGEIAASSVNIDLGSKLRVYESNQIQEYLVWRVPDRQIDWFVLHAGRFDPLAASPEGYLKSRVFPGLWLDSKAMVAGDMARVFKVLQEGLNSLEHQEFVASLTAIR